MALQASECSELLDPNLKLAHDLIQALLEAVRSLRLRVNSAKCSIMVRLSGTEAPSVTRRHTCWLPDASGELKKHWRIGPNKAYPAFRQEGTIKYLALSSPIPTLSFLRFATV